jgi:hypothetical protein
MLGKTVGVIDYLFLARNKIYTSNQVIFLGNKIVLVSIPFYNLLACYISFGERIFFHSLNFDPFSTYFVKIERFLGISSAKLK